jgi:hypothetical protein
LVTCYHCFGINILHNWITLGRLVWLSHSQNPTLPKGGLKGGTDKENAQQVPKNYGKESSKVGEEMSGTGRGSFGKFY